LNSKAMTCIWMTPDQKEEEWQAATVQQWAKDIGWKTTSRRTKNAQHNGHVRGRSMSLFAAKERGIKRLPQHFSKLNDGHHCFERILDVGDGTIKDCISYFGVTTEDRKPSRAGAKVKTKTTVRHDKGRENEINVFDMASISPTLADKQRAFATNAFATETTDVITAKKPDQHKNRNC
jgi:hypothetical protein